MGLCFSSIRQTGSGSAGGREPPFWAAGSQVVLFRESQGAWVKGRSLGCQNWLSSPSTAGLAHTHVHRHRHTHTHARTGMIHQAYAESFFLSLLGQLKRSGGGGCV